MRRPGRLSWLRALLIGNGLPSARPECTCLELVQNIAIFSIQSAPILLSRVFGWNLLAHYKNASVAELSLMSIFKYRRHCFCTVNRDLLDSAQC